MKLKATSNGIDPREHDPSVTNNESESEECASSVCEENEFEMEDEEAEQSDAEIKVEDDWLNEMNIKHSIEANPTERLIG